MTEPEARQLLRDCGGMDRRSAAKKFVIWEKYGSCITNGLAICGIVLSLLAVTEFVMLGPDFFNGPPSYMHGRL
jgi:hypothetical protein